MFDPMTLSLQRAATTRVSAWLLAAAALVGCAGGEARVLRAPSERLCARLQPVMAPERAPMPDVEFRLRTAGFSPQAIAAAQATGAAPALVGLAELRTRDTVAPLRLHREVSNAIMLGMLDVASTVAEIDCEGERGDQLRGQLQAVLDRRTRQLGIASIMMGATTAALTGGLSLAGAANAGNIAGIAGGGGEAGLALSLVFGEAEGELITSRNLLAEVWARPARPVLLPRSVWRYLTQPDPDGSTRLDRLHAEWRTPELLGEPDSETERRRAALLFGPGGRFTPAELEIRDAMLDLLEASVALMNQDLRALLLEVAARP